MTDADTLAEALADRDRLRASMWVALTNFEHDADCPGFERGIDYDQELCNCWRRPLRAALADPEVTDA